MKLSKLEAQQQRIKKKLIIKKGKQLAGLVLKLYQKESFGIRSPLDLFHYLGCGFPTDSKVDMLVYDNPALYKVTNTHFLITRALGCRGCLNARTLRTLWQEFDSVESFENFYTRDAGININPCKSAWTLLLPEVHTLAPMTRPQTKIMRGSQVYRVTIATEENAELGNQIRIAAKHAMGERIRGNKEENLHDRVTQAMQLLRDAQERNGRPIPWQEFLQPPPEAFGDMEEMGEVLDDDAPF